MIAMSRAISVATIGEWNRAMVLGYVPLQMATSSAQQALYPEFRSAVEDRARTREVWSRLFGLSVLLVWPICAAALPWLPFGTRILLGPDWSLAGSMAQWLLAATAIYFPLAILWAAQESAAMFKEIWTGFGTYAVIMFIAAGCVVVTHDWHSAAVGMVLASAATLGLNLVMLVRSHLLDSSLVGRDLRQAMAAVGLLGLCSAGFAQYLSNSWLGVVLSLAVAGFVYSRIVCSPQVVGLRGRLRAKS